MAAATSEERGKALQRGVVDRGGGGDRGPVQLAALDRGLAEGNGNLDAERGGTISALAAVERSRRQPVHPWP